MAAGRPSVRYQALITLLAVLMIASLLRSLAGFWHLTTPPSGIYLYAGAGALFAWLSWRYPWVATGLVIAVAAAVGGAVSLGHLQGFVNWVVQINLEAVEFTDALRASSLDATFGAALGSLFLGLTAGAAGLVILPETLSRGNTFWSVALGTLVFGVQWAWYYDAASLHFMGFAVTAFLLWTLGQAAVRDAHWEASGRKVGYRSHVATPVVWVLVVGMFATILPANFDPVNLGAWGEKAQEAFPVLRQLRGAGVGAGGRFSLRATGFNPSLGALGGPVSLDHSVALYVTTDSAIPETMYLRGATFRAYEGRTWETGKPDEVEVKQDSTLPTYMGSDVMRDYLTFKVKPNFASGFTLFNLLEPMQVKGLKNAYKADVDNNLWSTKSLPKNTVYELSARWPRYSAEQIRKIEWTAPGDEFAPYLELPASLPDRVRELTRSLAEPYAHPYDQATAVESYLRSLPYELNVPATPGNRDFVDYFLFDLQKGYCVYSATAMAVMLRDLGIPTRLVEGFALPVSTQYTEGADGKLTYSVLNSQAHAWVEAYFPNYGWVTFDPTPRSDLPIIDRSAPAPQSPEVSEKPDQAGDKAPRANIPNEGEQDFNEGMDRTPEDATPLPARAARQWPWAVAVLLPVLAAFALAYRRLKRQDRIVSSEEREVVQEVWTKTGSLMSQFEAGPKPHQTAQEYAEVLGKKWPGLKEPATQVAREYTEARYAPPARQVAGEATNHAKSLWDRIHELLFDRYGWRSYFWRRLKWKYKA
ncbi:MAG TPA: transglutaminaseTgpA domain-containing protein [Symbiobacteriaceae bacterium]|nr:transglutaminaseTgpA domain-containing protein [Symbiobacteriaceae bacterium]